MARLHLKNARRTCGKGPLARQTPYWCNLDTEVLKFYVAVAVNPRLATTRSEGIQAQHDFNASLSSNAGGVTVGSWLIDIIYTELH